MAQAPQWTVSDLDDRLEAGPPFYLLDVRNRDEFEATPVEGREPGPQRNVPYFEMLEAAGMEDLVDSVESYARAELAAELPRDQPVLAVCAKGDTSEFVARALVRLGYDAANLAGGTRAWGDHYRVKPVVREDGLTILQIARPARGCLSHLVVSDGRAVVVDPARHAEQYVGIAGAEGAAIEGLIDTHGHADHISGGPALAGALDVPYHLHPYDAIHPIDLVPGRLAYEALRAEQEITVGRVTVRALWVPGHTLGNLALLVADRYLLAGDTLFLDSVARPDLGGRAETWAPMHHESLARLLELPDETVVLPGHFSSRREADSAGVFAARLGDLRDANEGLRQVRRGREEFVRYILDSLPRFPDEYVEIKRVNAGLLIPDEEEARELETGKNLCALARAAAAVAAQAAGSREEKVG
jgi:glyoxylase-like metal-dependent hydrolase (beta-lactamase superfamily II)/rhodanese-related sulfurtransferase